MPQTRGKKKKTSAKKSTKVSRKSTKKKKSVSSKKAKKSGAATRKTTKKKKTQKTAKKAGKTAAKKRPAKSKKKKTIKKTSATQKPMMKSVKPASKEPIVIDQANGLIFDSETDLFEYFEPAIRVLEVDYLERREKKDFDDQEQLDWESCLDPTLDDPDEVWERKLGDDLIYIFLRTFAHSNHDIHYIAVCYLADDLPTFVYLHFATRFRSFMQTYRTGELIYNRAFRDTEECAIEGDALSEGDELAMGLCEAMLKIRSSRDIPAHRFREYAEYREEAIEEADEIWRTTDLDGNILVSFVRNYSEDEEDLHYVVVTVEDTASKVHSLLFSFPTTDVNLVERYRNGENLQAEEVVQESSH